MTNAIIVLLVAGLTTVVTDGTCPGLPQCFCSKDKTSVNCEGKHFSTVPDNIPTSVVKLYLGYNQITKINTNTFGSFPKLERLWLQKNTISVLQPYAFGNLSSLTSLNLQQNKLAVIDKNAFSNMKSLDKLYLISNKIQRIHEEAFDGTESVTYISLQSNKLIATPPLGYMPKLQKLVLEGNMIVNVTFPACFNTAKRLFYIGASNNNIPYLSNDTFEALRNNSISSLYLSRNKLKKIESGTFAPLESIKSLKLGTNPLNATALRTAIESLQGKSMASLDISGVQLNGVLLKNTFKLLENTPITTLNMESNKIATIPDDVFSGLNKLLHLDLTSCDIQLTSSAAFDGLDKLTVLNLNKNKLINIPKNLPSTLVNLYLDNNEIMTIVDKSFSNLAYLQELRIRYNKVQTLEQDSFVGLLQLSKLSLYDNNIATLPGKVFAPLVRLISLDLAANNLASIQYSKDRLFSLGSLIYLNLADNKLSYLQPDFFQYTISLKYLHLERNLLGDLLMRDYGGVIFKGLVKLSELNLMDNKIRSIPDPTFQDLDSLQFLNLTNNKLAEWGPNLFKATQNLHVLDLTNNLLPMLHKENVHDFTAMQSLNLTGNPFVCNCDMRWFRDWVNKTRIVLTNNATYRCNGPTDWAGRRFLSFDRTKINCVFFTWYDIVIASAVGILLVLVIAGISYRKRWWIKLFIYKRMRRRNNRKFGAADGRGRYGAIAADEGGRKFDAYISCADDDYKWVLDCLLPGVDKGRIDDEHQFQGRFSLYFEDRDAEAGKEILMFSLLVGFDLQHYNIAFTHIFICHSL